MEGAQRSHRSQTGHLLCHPGREVEIRRYAILERITKFALNHPKIVISLAVLLTVIFGLQFPRITIDNDYLVQPQVAYKFSDNLSATLGANIFGGEKATTFFGQFDKNDNAYFSVRFDF